MLTTAIIKLYQPSLAGAWDKLNKNNGLKHPLITKPTWFVTFVQVRPFQLSLDKVGVNPLSQLHLWLIGLQMALGLPCKNHLSTPCHHHGDIGTSLRRSSGLCLDGRLLAMT